MKLIKCIIAAIGILTFTTATFAQRGAEHRAEKLKSALELTDEQWEELQPVLENQKAQMKALRDQDFESREERIAAAKAIQSETEEAVSEILTAEQIAKWGEMKKKIRHRRAKGHRSLLSEDEAKAMKEEVKAYKEKNIHPVMKEERLAFEEKISAEDKAEIDRLRSVMKEKKSAKKEEFKARRKSGERMSKEERKAKKEAFQNDPDHLAVKALVEKYKSDLEQIKARLEPQQEQWKEDTKAIMKKHIDAAKESANEQQAEGQSRNARRHKKRGERAKEFAYAKFLLMDPNESSGQKQGKKSGKSAIGKFKVYPNPATTNSTVAYTLKRDSYITLSLRDKEGNMIQVLEQGQFAKGEHQFEVPVSSLKKGVYLLSIEDGSGKAKSKKMMVQ